MKSLEMSANKLRLAFLGDSITVGDGDTHAKGWPSRLCEISSPMPSKTQCYNLGVGGDHVADIARRASAELRARLTNKEGRGVVIMMGVNNALRAAAKVNSTPLELDAIKADVIKVITEAQQYGGVLVVEPAPVLLEFQHRDGISGSEVNEHLVDINKALKFGCERLGVSLLKLTDKLMADTDYLHALGDGDGLHPHNLGYECIAKHIASSTEWSEFLEKAKKDTL